MHRRRPFPRFVLPLVAAGLAGAALLAPAPSAALEMVSNGRFDTGIASWPGSIGGGALGWDGTRDASGSALSGSLRFEHLKPPPGDGSSYSLFLTRCFPAAPGAAYFGGATLRLLENEASEARAKVLLRGYPTASCTGTATTVLGSDELRTDLPPGRGVWTRLEVATPGAPLVLPAPTASIGLVIFLTMLQGTKATLNVDDAFLAPAGTPVCDGLPATMVGTSGPDLLIGTDASDVIVGRGGADQIDGKGGNDRICGGAGGDTIYGGAGDDDLFGSGGADKLYGAAGDDLLVGGRGGDTLYGGNDSDVLRGNGGNDSCDGGTGGDVAKTCETVTAIP